MRFQRNGKFQYHDNSPILVLAENLIARIADNESFLILSYVQTKVKY